jgi:co-chaperonin GroES (HSP10)
VWRVGKVILAGPNCKTVKEGDYIVFPNDKGIQAANINDLKNIVFLSENRIFGVCETNFKET